MSLLPNCNNQTLTISQLLAYAKQAGFTGSDMITIVAISLAESSGNTCSWNPNDPNGGSFGVLQINGAHFHSGATSQSCALDPQCSFTYGHSLFTSQGFKPWGTFTNGSYLQYMGQVSSSSPSPVVPTSSSNLGTGSLNPLQPIQDLFSRLGPLWDWLSNPIRILKMVVGMLLVVGSILLLIAPDIEQGVQKVAESTGIDL